MDENSLSIGASLEEIKNRIATIQEKPLDSHPSEYEEIFQLLSCFEVQHLRHLYSLNENFLHLWREEFHDLELD